MSHTSAQQKHDILVHCESRRGGETEVEVADLHGVVVNRKTLYRWRSRWNRTPQSLERREGSGATPILTSLEISGHIRAPILAANRSHRAIHYTDLLKKIQEKTGKSISIRTIRRIGQQQLRIQQKHTQKRTRQECE